MRVPPQDIEMEGFFSGALMLNQNAMYEAADVVGVDSFYSRESTATIYGCDARTLRKERSCLTLPPFRSKLKERKQLKDGGRRFADHSDIVNSAASPGSCAALRSRSCKPNSCCARLIDGAAKNPNELGTRRS